METTIQKWGNSLAVRIPQHLAKESHLTEGATVSLVSDEGKLILEPVQPKRYHLKKLLRQITRKNLHEKIDLGSPMGKEIW